MPLTDSYIKKIMLKYKDSFEALEHYDLTREKTWGRARIDITLNRKLISKLKNLKKKTGKPVSQIIEECIEKYLIHN